MGGTGVSHHAWCLRVAAAPDPELRARWPLHAGTAVAHIRRAARYPAHWNHCAQAGGRQTAAPLRVCAHGSESVRSNCLQSVACRAAHSRAGQLQRVGLLLCDSVTSISVLFTVCEWWRNLVDGCARDSLHVRRGYLCSARGITCATQTSSSAVPCPLDS